MPQVSAVIRWEKDDTQVTLKRNPETDGPQRVTQKAVSHQVWHAMSHACYCLCRCVSAVTGQVCAEMRQGIATWKQYM